MAKIWFVHAEKNKTVVNLPCHPTSTVTSEQDSRKCVEQLRRHGWKNLRRFEGEWIKK